MIDAPEPSTINELQSFLGAVNYYGKFIKHMSSITSPLYQLRRKDVPWKWAETEKDAFQLLKKYLMETSLLCLYDKNVKLACDASSYGVGAVMSHVFPQ